MLIVVQGGCDSVLLVGFLRVLPEAVLAIVLSFQDVSPLVFAGPRPGSRRPHELRRSVRRKADRQESEDVRDLPLGSRQAGHETRDEGQFQLSSALTPTNAVAITQISRAV